MKTKLYGYEEMNYTVERKKEVLVHGEVYGYNFYIISYGTHPCCYIELPKEHKFYGKHYDDIEIECHDGLTYTENYLRGLIENSWVIGWDYAHWNDYAGYYEEIFKNDSNFNECKKWTTEELLDEVIEVIIQLKASMR